MICRTLPFNPRNRGKVTHILFSFSSPHFSSAPLSVITIARARTHTHTHIYTHTHTRARKLRNQSLFQIHKYKSIVSPKTKRNETKICPNFQQQSKYLDNGEEYHLTLYHTHLLKQNKNKETKQNRTETVCLPRRLCSVHRLSLIHI